MIYIYIYILTFSMPTPAPHRNQSSDLRLKSIEWFQHKKSIDTKKANSNISTTT